MAEDPKKALEHILRAGLKAVDPERAVRKYVRRKGNRLFVGDRSYALDRFKRILLIGAGKGTAPMAKALEEIFGDYLTDGWIIVKYGYGMPLEKTHTMEAGHPIPDEAGLKATEVVLDQIRECTEEDLIICAFSGGGSALLAAPASPINLDQKQETTRLLLDSGATINEINAIRKHLSRTKGGWLAKTADPATLVSLILSDVIGDRLDVIASGPTVPDESTFADCTEIIQRYDLVDRLPETVAEYFRQGGAGIVPETPKVGDPVFSRVQNLIVGNNRGALLAAQEQAISLGYKTMILSSQIEGEAREVAQVFAAIGKEICQAGLPISPPACVLAGGEPTVTIQGKGKGGRNQELALACAISIDGWDRIFLLSAGTDGTDGPTDAAGAIVSGLTCRRARQADLNPYSYLLANDSYSFFESLGDLLKTGPTRTNVMDIICMLVEDAEP
ncbi:MAG: glycerate kinase [Deltaproteobacteria bacterium]|nr:MAG: glycerate kinase [Deltaproteobacteria bacterium]